MKKTLILLLFICSGLVIGYFVSDMTAGISWLKWLSYGLSFGMTNPLTLDLKIITLTFGLSFRLNLCIIIFTALSGYLYYYFNHRSGRKRG